MKNSNMYYIPEYKLGGWLKEHSGGIIGGLTTLGGAAMTLVNPIAGAAMLGSGVGMINNDIQQSKQADMAKSQAKEQTAAMNQQNKAAYIQQKEQEMFGDSNMPIMAAGGFIPTNDYMGQTHEGPDGGIPIDASGNPSVQSNQQPVGLVENGEVGFDRFIFSDKLKLPKSKETFADKAKSIKSKYKKRLGEDFKGNDKYAKEALELELTSLSEQQEELKLKKAQELGLINTNETQQSSGQMPQFEDGGVVPREQYPDYVNNLLYNLRKYGADYNGTLPDARLINGIQTMPRDSLVKSYPLVKHVADSVLKPVEKSFTYKYDENSPTTEYAIIPNHISVNGSYVRGKGLQRGISTADGMKHIGNGVYQNARRGVSSNQFDNVLVNSEDKRGNIASMDLSSLEAFTPPVYEGMKERLPVKKEGFKYGTNNLPKYVEGTDNINPRDPITTYDSNGNLIYQDTNNLGSELSRIQAQNYQAMQNVPTWAEMDKAADPGASDPGASDPGSIVPSYIGAGASVLGNIGQMVSANTLANKLEKTAKDNKVNAYTYTPEDISFASSREQNRARALDSRREGLRMLRGTGSNYSDYALKFLSDSNKGLSDQLINSEQQEELANVGARNAASQFNNQMLSQTDQFNLQNKQMLEGQALGIKNQAFNNLMNSVAGGVQHVASGYQERDRFANTAKIMADNYEPITTPDGQIVYIPKK